MKDFKRWLLPVAIVCLLLSVLAGSCAPQSLGEVLDPSGNPFAHRFSDVKDIRTATFVVAASDSEHRYEADYFCDGTNDEVQIQAAIDAATGRVILLEGTYYLGSNVNVSAQKILEGQGYGTLIRPTTPGAMTPWFVNLYADSVLRNLRLDAMATGMGDPNLDCITVYGDGAVVESCWLTGARNAAVDLTTGIDNCRILNNRIWDTYCHCVWITSKNNTVSENVIINTLASCIGTDTGANQNIIANNHLISPSHLAIEVVGGVRNLIEGNVCYGADAGGASDGIRLQSESHENTIKNNIIQGFVDGIDLTDSDYNLVTGNLCKNNTQDGIRVTTSDYNELALNRCTDDQGTPTQDHGINIVSGTGNLVLDNDLSGLHTTSDFADTGTDTRGREAWIQMDYTTGAWSSQFNYAAALLTVNGQIAGVTFHVPDNFNGIIKAEIVFIPIAGGVNEDIDIQSTYAALGEGNNTHSEADAATTYTLTAGEMSSISIAGILSVLTAGDFVGVQLIHNNAAADNAYILGVRFVYA